MWRVSGQRHILHQIEANLKLGQMPHALLLSGPPHVGKMTLALDLAQALNCTDTGPAPCGICSQCLRIAQGLHPDVRTVSIQRGSGERPSRTVIGIDDIKDVLRQVSMKPYEGSRIVIIFDGAESMSEEAANAVLKTLEEPPPDVVFLLLTANEEALLPTIRSRCQKFSLTTAPLGEVALRLEEEHNAAPEESQRLARLSRGCMGWAVTALNDPNVVEELETQLDRMISVCCSGLPDRFAYAAELATLFSRDREAARQVLYLWLRWWRDLLLIKEGAEEYVANLPKLLEMQVLASHLTTAGIVGFVKRLLSTLEALDRNAGPRLALESLMLDLPTSFPAQPQPGP